MSLDERFNQAAEKVKNLKTSPSDAELKEIYALFKQATVGDINIERPGMLDLKGKQKWDAWNSKKGLSADAAKEAYIKAVDALVAKIGLK